MATGTMESVAEEGLSQPEGVAATTATSNTATSDPLTSPLLSVDDLCPGVSSLQDLALRGSWRSILDHITRSRALSILQQPHHHLTYLTYAVLAFTKLRLYDEAIAELQTLDHHFDSPSYRYESHPQFYHGRSGSMVPFSLRFIHAELPAKTGKRQETIDRLYTLLTFVRSKLEHSQSDITNSSVSLGLWKSREKSVFDSIICHHLSAKEYDLCFNLIQRFMGGGNHEDLVLWSRLGYLQLQVGDVDGAKESFRVVEGMVVAEAEGEKGLGDMTLSELRSLVNRNKGLIYLVEKDYVSAVREYDECIDRDDADAVAVNNKSLCLMYLRDLSDSIKVLEAALERAPTVFLNETLVVNLCSMYELAYVNHTDIKRTLSNWIARVAPDDFDTSCTRI